MCDMAFHILNNHFERGLFALRRCSFTSHVILLCAMRKCSINKYMYTVYAYEISHHQTYLWITEVIFLHRLTEEPNLNQELHQPSFHPLGKHLVEENPYLGRYIHHYSLFCMGHTKICAPFCSCCGGAYINGNTKYQSFPNGDKTCSNKLNYCINGFQSVKFWRFWLHMPEIDLLSMYAV